MSSLRYLIATSIYPLAAFALSLILTRICIAVLPRLGYMDIPKGRHIHKVAVPRAGGIGFILAFWITIFLYVIKYYSFSGLLQEPIGQFLVPLAGGSVILFFTGLYDDRYDMPSVIKLMFQIAAGVTLYYLGGGIRTIFNYTLPNWCAIILTVGWTIGIVNAFNLIDGLDGLAAGLASIASICIAIWTMINSINLPMAVVLLIFCAVCLGFLIYNFSPARIFMGDTGSMFLGLFFAATSMDQCSRPAVTAAALLVPLVAIGVPIFDVILAIWRRSIRRYGFHMLKDNLGNEEVVTELENGINSTGTIQIDIAIENESGVMNADQDHLHHRLLRETKNKTSRAVLLIYGISVAFSLFAIGLTFIGYKMPALAFLLTIIGVFFTLRLANVELLASMSVVAQGVRFPRKSFLLTAIHPLLDFFLLMLSFFLVYGIQERPIRAIYHQGGVGINILVTFVVPYFVVLIGSGIYRTYWLRASIERYYTLFKLLFLGACISFILLNIGVMSGWFFEGVSKRMVTIIFLLETFFSCSFIMIERFTLHFFEGYALRSYYLKNAPEAKLYHTIIYGGGLGCRMYVNSLYSSRHFSCAFQILGIVDEDKSLQNLNISGFRVLGTSMDLEKLYKKQQFDTIVLTTANVSGEIMDRIRTFAGKHDIRLTMFLAQEYPADMELFKELQNKAIRALNEDKAVEQEEPEPGK